MSRQDATGSVTAFTVLLMATLMSVLGLVTEGGQVMAARERAMADAEQAARAGAAVLSPAAAHLGDILDPGPAPARAAEQALAADGRRGTATVAGRVVTVRLSPFHVPTPLLALVGIPSVSVGASASAEAVDG